MRNPGSKLIALGSISILAVLVVAGTANARTRGFTIYNFSSTAVKLTDLMPFGTPAGEPIFEAGSVPPKVGMVLDPGQKSHFELENPFGYTRRAQLEFSGGGSTFNVFADNYFKTRCTSSGRECDISNGGGHITFLDPPARATCSRPPTSRARRRR